MVKLSMSRHFLFGFMGFFLLTAATVATADVYKWVDKDGKVHYSDQPTTADAKKLGAKSRDAVSATRANSDGTAAKAPASIADQEMEFRKRKMEKEESEKKALVAEQDAKKKLSYCNNLRGELQSYDDGVRIVRHSDKGERIFLDDAERAKSKTHAQERFTKECK
ncbi:MAG: DUF4124 domain-containing protein [Burkholderiales bacterium]